MSSLCRASVLAIMLLAAGCDREERDPRGRRSYLEGARLGLPVGLATKTGPPLVYLSKRFNKADEAAPSTS